MRKTQRKQLKRLLEAAFPPPEPEKKRAFLRTLPQPQLSTAAFVRGQAAYIPKWVWALFAGLLVLAVWLTTKNQETMQTAQALSSLTPFLALTAVAQTARARAYQMEELELATRFGLKSVLLARMTILGLIHLALLGLLLVLAQKSSAGPWLETGCRLLLPYLLSTGLGLEVSRHLRGQEAPAGCLAVAAAVCATGVLAQLLQRDGPRIEQTPGQWLLALAVLGLWTVREYAKTIGQTEELTWS